LSGGGDDRSGESWCSVMGEKIVGRRGKGFGRKTRRKGREKNEKNSCRKRKTPAKDKEKTSDVVISCVRKVYIFFLSNQHYKRRASKDAQGTSMGPA